MRNGFGYIWIFIIVLSSAVNCAIVCGSITSDENNKPLMDANVRLLEAADPTIGNTTAADGYFCLRGLKSGDYLLQVTSIGYWNKKVSITIANDSDTIVLNIKLSPSRVYLDTIPEIENYHRYFSALKTNEILEIHLDSLEFRKIQYRESSFAYQFLIHSVFTNKTDKPIYILGNLNCFIVMEPLLHNSKGEEMKANMFFPDCMEKDLPDSSDLLEIPPHTSIKYQPLTMGLYNFLYYPKDSYSIKLVYDFKRPDRLHGVYSDPERDYKKIFQKPIHYLNMALRGKFISNNELRFDNHEISQFK